MWFPHCFAIAVHARGDFLRDFLSQTPTFGLCLALLWRQTYRINRLTPHAAAAVKPIVSRRAEKILASAQKLAAHNRVITNSNRNYQGAKNLAK